MRCWERVFRRAGVPLEFTHGFTPHPRISFGAPLAVGFTSGGELMDVWIRKWMPPDAVVMLARREIPGGFVVHDAIEMPLSAPSLQSVIESAVYKCVAVHPAGVDGAREAVEAFLSAESVQHAVTRGDNVKTVELRQLVRNIELGAATGQECEVLMRVSLSQEGTVRPEHVLEVLGFNMPATSIHRVAVSLEP
jgi:radical SAM-linked protein